MLFLREKKRQKEPCGPVFQLAYLAEKPVFPGPVMPPGKLPQFFHFIGSK